MKGKKLLLKDKVIKKYPFNIFPQKIFIFKIKLIAPKDIKIFGESCVVDLSEWGAIACDDDGFHLHSLKNLNYTKILNPPP